MSHKHASSSSSGNAHLLLPRVSSSLPRSASLISIPVVSACRGHLLRHPNEPSLALSPHESPCECESSHTLGMRGAACSGAWCFPFLSCVVAMSSMTGQQCAEAAGRLFWDCPTVLRVGLFHRLAVLPHRPLSSLSSLHFTVVILLDILM